MVGSMAMFSDPPHRITRGGAFRWSNYRIFAALHESHIGP
jgi:hypothetical protein